MDHKFYLTFDGAPHPPGTEQILEILERHQVKGTFFMEGHRMKKHPELVQKIWQKGHGLGNHTFHHRKFDELSLEECLKEVEETDHLFQEYIGRSVFLIRPPWGIVSKEVEETLKKRGYKISLWTYSIKDWEGPNAKEVARRILAGAHPDGIIVMHDHVLWNAEALDLIIPELKKLGYKFSVLA